MNAPFAKPAEWHAARLKGIGGSDANIILSGEPERVLTLWKEKTGKQEPEDLSWVLPVQIGSATEALNVAWFEHFERPVTDRNKMLTHARREYMRCELDGLTTTESGAPAVFEAKHVNAFGAIEDVVQRYMPQLHHNMHVAGVEYAVLSVIQGTQKWECFEVACDPFYLAALLDAEEDFWRCVEADDAPVGFDMTPPKVEISEFREVDMSQSNEWGAFAADWLAHKDAAKKFKGAEKGLKDLTEADVGLAYGSGVQVKRTKNGSLRISEVK